MNKNTKFENKKSHIKMLDMMAQPETVTCHNKLYFFGYKT